MQALFFELFRLTRQKDQHHYRAHVTHSRVCVILIIVIFFCLDLYTHFNIRLSSSSASGFFFPLHIFFKRNSLLIFGSQFNIHRKIYEAWIQCEIPVRKESIRAQEWNNFKHVIAYLCGVLYMRSFSMKRKHNFMNTCSVCAFIFIHSFIR